MSIHATHPFATPEPDRSSVRRLRGRLTAPVTLWTAPGPAGLTISSMLVADGDPGRVLGLVNDESELWEVLSDAGRFAVTPLAAGDQQLADRFAGIAPAPGGLFAQQGDTWHETGYGPIPGGDRTWAGCTLTEARPCGWGLLIEGVLDEIALADSEGEAGPLAFYRGRYRLHAD